MRFWFCTIRALLIAEMAPLVHSSAVTACRLKGKPWADISDDEDDFPVVVPIPPKAPVVAAAIEDKDTGYGKGKGKGKDKGKGTGNGQNKYKGKDKVDAVVPADAEARTRVADVKAKAAASVARIIFAAEKDAHKAAASFARIVLAAVAAAAKATRRVAESKATRINRRRAGGIICPFDFGVGLIGPDIGPDMGSRIIVPIETQVLARILHELHRENDN